MGKSKGTSPILSTSSLVIDRISCKFATSPMFCASLVIASLSSGHTTSAEERYR